MKNILVKTIQQKCEQCALSRAYDWERGFNRRENLVRQGWKIIENRWICPDCVEKRNHDR